MKYIKRKVKINRIQLHELSLEKMYKYYDNYEKHRDITVVYKGEEYVGFFCDEFLKLCVEETDLLYYCTRSKNELTIELSEQSDEKLISSMIKSIMLSPCSFVYIKNTEEIVTIENDGIITVELLSKRRQHLKSELEGKGVSVYTVKIDNIRPEYCVPNSTYETAFPLFWSDTVYELSENKIGDITEGNFDEIRELHKQETFVEKYGDEDRRNKIYLVGPCIVSGWPYTVHKDELAYMLSKLTNEYSIIKVVGTYDYSSCIDRILEYDIEKGDIVLFIDELDDNYIDISLDLSDVLNQKMEHSLFHCTPIHTTVWGNRLVAKQIYDNIISLEEKKYYKNLKKENGENDVDNNLVVFHKREKQWINNDLYYELDLYIEECKSKFIERFGKYCWENKNNQDIGAIYMSANPFTNGHRRLVEYASSCVDILILFVVENDNLDFPYNVRKMLIEQGTSDLQNVLIVDGRNIVATNETFTSYFKRESMNGKKIDPIKDVYIFSNYIVPALGITKRFVGEEPIDYVTNEYNKQMKEESLLHAYELIEIPRKTYDGEYISASRVRKFFKEKNWDNIKKIVPDTTYNFLIKNENEKFEKKAIQPLLYSTNWLFDKLKNGYKVIMYGLGHDIEIIMKMIDEKYYDQLEYCVSDAKNKTLYYKGKKVISPNEIGEDDFIFISTREYKKEIYKMLYDGGIASENIMVISDNIEIEVVGC
ncbi:MAG: hypothetical protein ACI4D4_00565 [Lachnospira sp.]